MYIILLAKDWSGSGLDCCAISKTFENDFSAIKCDI